MTDIPDDVVEALVDEAEIHRLDYPDRDDAREAIRAVLGALRADPVLTAKALGGAPEYRLNPLFGPWLNAYAFERIVGPDDEPEVRATGPWVAVTR